MLAVRVTLVSRNVASLERVSADIVRNIKQQRLDMRGPIRMPTKNLAITTRKSPCGEGSKTWDRFEMRIHKRVIDMTTSPAGLRDITKVPVDEGVSIAVTIQQ
eukprot:gnl/Ergobibamus_cyprinoides/491.p8 GENE.gnl/Ergobibamus_cyprinoides/491~~gnl/Ergobibamus_cyprinoides/491.p8  ORF type:complete len:103 (+),score=47.10 gnl/Ergobibamus_cyprinoides/491:3335-3643(+)